MKSIIWGVGTTLISFIVMYLFLFVSTGFIPNECLLVTNHGECKGIAGIFPYPLRLLIVIAIIGYSIYIGIKSGLEYNEENKLKIKNKKWLENYQKENNIIPIKKRSEK